MLGTIFIVMALFMFFYPLMTLILVPTISTLLFLLVALFEVVFLLSNWEFNRPRFRIAIAGLFALIGIYLYTGYAEHYTIEYLPILLGLWTALSGFLFFLTGYRLRLYQKRYTTGFIWFARTMILIGIMLFLVPIATLYQLLMIAVGLILMAGFLFLWLGLICLQYREKKGARYAK